MMSSDQVEEASLVSGSPSPATYVTGEEIAREITGQQFEPIKQYVDILLNRGISQGLIGPREAPRIWERHILNCLAMTPLIPRGAAVVDVGSGAGLPGLPVALARRDLHVTLVESMLRRTTFLERVVTDLGLNDRVTVVRGRAEDLSGSYDVVTARAVAPLGKLIGWVASLLAPDGQILALKGESVDSEVAEARPLLDKLSLITEVRAIRAHRDVTPTYVVRVTRG